MTFNRVIFNSPIFLCDINPENLKKKNLKLCVQKFFGMAYNTSSGKKYWK